MLAFLLIFSFSVAALLIVERFDIEGTQVASQRPAASDPVNASRRARGTAAAAAPRAAAVRNAIGAAR